MSLCKRDGCDKPLPAGRSVWCSDACYQAAERERASAGGGILAQKFSGDGFEERMSIAQKALRAAGYEQIYRRCGPAECDFLCRPPDSDAYVRVSVAPKAPKEWAVDPPIELLVIVKRRSASVVFHDEYGEVGGQSPLGLRVPPSSQASRKAERKPPKPDPVRDCVKAQWWPSGVPKSQGSKFGMVVRDFKEIGATPDDIVARRAVAKGRWGEGMDTAMGVLAQWGHLAPPPKRVYETYTPDPWAKECFVCGSEKLHLWSTDHLEAACTKHLPELEAKYPLEPREGDGKR